MKLHFYTISPKNSKSTDLEFFYPSRRLGISSEASRYIIKGGFPPLHLITHQRASSCGLMIYNTTCWWYAIPSELMIYTPYGVILWWVEFLYYERIRGWIFRPLFYFKSKWKATSFDRRSTSFQSEKLLRNFARTSFLICSAQMNEVALRADLNSPPLNSELLSKLWTQRDSNRRQTGSTTEQLPISYSTCSMPLKLNYIRLIWSRLYDH